MAERFTLKLRRNTAVGWTILDPVLQDGEPGYERDTGKLKVGNGLQKWSDLSYVVREDANVSAHITAAEPHPEYDDLPSLSLLFENGLV